VVGHWARRTSPTPLPSSAPTCCTFHEAFYHQCGPGLDIMKSIINVDHQGRVSLSVLNSSSTVTKVTLCNSPHDRGIVLLLHGPFMNHTYTTTTNTIFSLGLPVPFLYPLGSTSPPLRVRSLAVPLMAMSFPVTMSTSLSPPSATLRFTIVFLKEKKRMMVTRTITTTITNNLVILGEVATCWS